MLRGLKDKLFRYAPGKWWHAPVFLALRLLMAAVAILFRSASARILMVSPCLRVFSVIIHLVMLVIAGEHGVFRHRRRPARMPPVFRAQ